MLNIVINGKKVKAQEGSTVLENIQALKIDIPTLCYHKELSPFGACRLCSVEMKANGKWQIATSCNTPVESGMEIRTDSDAAKASLRQDMPRSRGRQRAHLPGSGPRPGYRRTGDYLRPERLHRLRIMRLRLPHRVCEDGDRRGPADHLG